ncbi:MAG: hypothetical protein K2K98_11855 [Muribaculaceae bacterium]|nr:hypothetical protein [Muribaculaceae bacterium]
MNQKNIEEILGSITHNATEYEIYNGKSYSTYVVGARIKIIGEDHMSDYPAIKTEIDLPSISMYRLVGGCNNINKFKIEGTEYTEDANDLIANHPERILKLPSDYSSAKMILLSRYTGKILRIIARSALGTAKYGDRLYLFSVEE